MQQEQLIRKIRDKNSIVAITGGSGFIGCQLVRLHLARIENAHTPTMMTRSAIAESASDQ